MKKILIGVLMSGVVLAGCGPQNEEPTAPKSADIAEKEAPAPRAKTADVIVFGTWKPAEAREVLGVVQAGREVDIVAQAPGQLQNITVKLGDRVRQGQVIAVYDTNNDATFVQYLNAQSNLIAVKNTTKDAINQAKTQLQNAQQTTADQIRNAAVALENAKQTAAAQIAGAKVAFENSQTNQEASDRAEEIALETQYTGLLQRVKTAQTTLDSVFDWLDNIYLVSDQYRNREADYALRQIGNNNDIVYQKAKKYAEDFRRRAPLNPHIGGEKSPEKVVLMARYRLEEIDLLRSLLRTTDLLIRQTAVNQRFTEAHRAQFTQQSEDYLAQLDGLVSGLESGITGLETAASRSAQTLISGDTQITQARASLQTAADQAEAQIRAAESTLANVKAQAEAQIRAAETQVENAESSAKLQVQQAENQVKIAQASQADLVLEAPFSGTVTAVQAEDFQYVTPGTPLLSMIDAGHNPTIKVPVTREEYTAMKRSRSVVARLETGEEIRLSTQNAAQKLDPDSQKMEVELALGHLPEGILAGSLVPILVPVGAGEASLMPLSAVSFEPSGAEVLVLSDTGKAERRLVQTGKIVGDSVEITEGLMPADLVIEYRNRVSSGEIITPRR